MDCGESLILYVKLDCVNPELISDIFGNSDLQQDHLLSEDNMYHNSKNKINEKIYNLINELRMRKSSKYAPLKIVAAGKNTNDELYFYYKLIEDKFEGFKGGYNLDYNSFMSMLV